MTVEELETWTVKQLEDYLQGNMLALAVVFSHVTSPQQRYRVTLHYDCGWVDGRGFWLTDALATAITMYEDGKATSKDSGQ